MSLAIQHRWTLRLWKLSNYCMGAAVGCLISSMTCMVLAYLMGEYPDFSTSFFSLTSYFTTMSEHALTSVGIIQIELSIGFTLAAFAFDHLKVWKLKLQELMQD
jgi:hypothetical protein